MGRFDSYRERTKKEEAPVNRQVTHIFDAALETTNDIGFCGTNYALPPGTSTERTESYEALHVHPPHITSEFLALKNALPSIEVASMDELGRQCFRGVERLNTIQSVVHDAATESDENLLVCAPTGTGKTNIALLAILREVRLANGRKDFKVIYVAPLRALSSEITGKFKEQLNGLNLNVLMVTGEETPARDVIERAQVLVVTPEKWDVLTRRNSAWRFVNPVRLMIFDEVHMLQTERGPVLEAIIVRALNENRGGKPVRIVGLSATLPNYRDVARFLRVDEHKGLFHFDQRFRAVPLTQSYIGITTSMRRRDELEEMDRICYEQCVKFATEGQQVIVFTHSRMGAMDLCRHFATLAGLRNQQHLFEPSQNVVRTMAYRRALNDMKRAMSVELRNCLPHGFGYHHAGVTRRDRNIVERAFLDGHIRVLVSTATLAWGINLPAHAVIIKGTEVYDSEHGCMEDLDVLDVQQIFGRAGRPQFDDSGNGIIIGSNWKIQKYVEHLSARTPIESRLPSRLEDLLCAEVLRGTVTSIPDAMHWLRQTYFFIRYPRENKSDETVYDELMKMAFRAAQNLADAHMIKFDATDEKMGMKADKLGQIAYKYYIGLDTIRRLTAEEGVVRLDKDLDAGMALALISAADDFNIRSREGELDDLEDLYNSLTHREPLHGGSLASCEGKVNCLLQCYISRCWIETPSLASEMNCISDSASRVASAFYEIVREYVRSAKATQVALSVCKAIHLRQWPSSSPLWPMANRNLIKHSVVKKMDEEGKTYDDLVKFAVKFGLEARSRSPGGPDAELGRLVQALPRLQVAARVFTIPGCYEYSNLSVVASPYFNWLDEVHGGTCMFTVFVEDVQRDAIIHCSDLTIFKQRPNEMRWDVPADAGYVVKNYRVRVVSVDYMVPDIVSSVEGEAMGR